MQIFDSINVLGYLGEKIAVNILKYLETNRELLNDPLFDCAYRIARASFVKKYFGNVSLDIVANPFRFKLDSIKLDSSEMENSKKDTYYLVDLIKRYDVFNKYNDLLDGYIEI